VVKCDYCGREIEGLPYRCKYCGGVYCVWHHLPEEHECRGLGMARSPDAIERQTRAGTGEVAAPAARRTRPTLYRSELRDLAIGVAAVALAAAPSYSPYGLALGALTALLAYLPHELAHKVAAERLGYGARYVLTPWGLLLTLLSALPFVPVGVIVPGYVLVAGAASTRDEAVVSASGPLVNIAVAAAARALAGLPLCRRLAYFSALIAALNLVPIGPLDGRKVLRASPAAWLLLFAAALALLLLSI